MLTYNFKAVPAGFATALNVQNEGLVVKHQQKKITEGSLRPIYSNR